MRRLALIFLLGCSAAGAQILPTANGGTGEAGTFSGPRMANGSSADTAATAVQMFSPFGFQVTAGSGLHVAISGGNTFCYQTPYTYSGTASFTLPASHTSYISFSCSSIAPVSNIVNFQSNMQSFALATCTTNASAVTGCTQVVYPYYYATAQGQICATTGTPGTWLYSFTASSGAFTCQGVGAADVQSGNFIGGGPYSMALATDFTLPNVASFTPSNEGDLGDDTVGGNLVTRLLGTNYDLLLLQTGSTWTFQDCPAVSSTSPASLYDSGSPCVTLSGFSGTSAPAALNNTGNGSPATLQQMTKASTAEDAISCSTSACTVPSSATYSLATITLTGTPASVTWAAATQGGITEDVLIVENSTGGYTFAWPSNVIGGMTITTTANKRNIQHFVYSSSLSKWVGGGSQTNF
jgi:hypothetical protein